MIQVENHPNLVKNSNGLVVDVDKSGYNRYMSQKNATNKLYVLENEINNIKQGMTDIKEMLLVLLNKGNN